MAPFDGAPNRWTTKHQLVAMKMNRCCTGYQMSSGARLSGATVAGGLGGGYGLTRYIAPADFLLWLSKEEVTADVRGHWKMTSLMRLCHICCGKLLAYYELWVDATKNRHHGRLLRSPLSGALLRNQFLSGACCPRSIDPFCLRL